MNEPLRIGHMIGSLTIGGAERQVVNLLNELLPAHAVLVTLSHHLGELAEDLQAGVRVMQGRARRRSLPLDILRLAWKLRKLDLDVLQTHMYWANLVGCIAGRLAGVKVIVTTEHGRNERKPRVARWVERYIISPLADRRICVSEDIRNLRLKHDRVPEFKLCVIPNGTTVQSPLPIRRRVPLTVGALGRFIEAKDYACLVDAAGLLREQGLQIRLVIVGDGPERERLVEEVRTRGLSEIVDMPGYSTDAHSWLEQFDIYAVSSIREGQPLSLLEAMARGLPIVATSVGGIPKTVRDSEEALLVPPSNPAAMAAAIARLVCDPVTRERLGVAARQRQIKEFSISACLRRHMALYATIINERRF